MKKLIVLLVAVLSLPVYANVIVTADIANTYWVGNPDIKCAFLPPDNNSYGGNPTAYSSEGNWGPLDYVGQTFIATQNTKLGRLGVVLAGGSGVTLKLYLFDLGPSAAGEGPDSINLESLGTNLLLCGATGAALEFVTNGAPAGDSEIYMLDFIDNHQVNLTNGNRYMFMMKRMGTDVYIKRNATPTSYNNGAIYRSYTDTAGAGMTKIMGGTGARDAGVAVYYVPEPVTIALLSLGGLALLRKRS